MIIGKVLATPFILAYLIISFIIDVCFAMFVKDVDKVKSKFISWDCIQSLAISEYKFSKWFSLYLEKRIDFLKRFYKR